jgi:hypothetical protein
MRRSKVKYIKPPNTLKLKVGHGGLPSSILEKALEYMLGFDEDFRPDATRLINALKTARINAEERLAAEGGAITDVEEILKPVMQLKANGGMFKYALVSEVADICQQFLESLNKYDTQAIRIVKAHEVTLRVIIDNSLSGNGGNEGYELLLELHNACQRYFKKHKEG